MDRVSNVIDYLKWRGDLSFNQDNLNEVDNLILSSISYLEFDGIVNFDFKGKKVTLSEFAKSFKRRKLRSPVFYGNPFFNQIPDLLQKTAQTNRFANIKLSCYVNNIDHENSNQFSAILFTLNEGHHFIAFRGTDDTIAGWKEDFQMSFMDEVPAQRQAGDYLNKVVSNVSGRFYVGGHSKGGNLAVYSATHTDKRLRDKIIAVYNNDGPGFQTEVIQREGYQSMINKIYTFVPKSSIVGMLMEHGEEYKVVSSVGLGIMQHNLLNWEVSGPTFVYEKELTKNSQNFDTALRSWLNKLSVEQRTYFVDAIFEIIQATGAQTLSELSNEKLNAMDAMIKTYKNMDSSQQVLLKETIDAFIKEGQKVLKKSMEQNLHTLFSGEKIKNTVLDLKIKGKP